MQKKVKKSGLRTALIYDLRAGLRCYVRQHVTRRTVSLNLNWTGQSVQESTTTYLCSLLSPPTVDHCHLLQ